MEKFNYLAINILSAAALFLLLAAACWTDIQSRRIPNKLVVVGTLIGVALHLIFPKGAGLFNAIPGSLGILNSLFGFATGLFIFMPMYLLRAMGAGDVKLMAMIGAFLGPASITGAALMAFAAGGVLAVATALYKGLLRKTLENIQLIVIHTVINAKSRNKVAVSAIVGTTTKLPYALAITAGTALQILMARSGYALIS